MQLFVMKNRKIGTVPTVFGASLVHSLLPYLWEKTDKRRPVIVNNKLKVPPPPLLYECTCYKRAGCLPDAHGKVEQELEPTKIRNQQDYLGFSDDYPVRNQN